MQKLAEICIRRPVFATMIVLALMVLGVFAFFGLGVDLLPNVDVPTVAVSVQNPGASPDQMEIEVTKRIEDSINTISGIDELRSTSSDGFSQVIVTFTLDKNGDVAAQEVRDKVNLVLGDLPATARAPIIQKFDPGAAPILNIVVGGSRPLGDITGIAQHQLRDELQNISGVGQVELVGGAEREIQVQLNPERMRAYSVTVGEIIGALQQQNVEVPGGAVEQGARELTLRTLGKLSTAEEFNRVAIAKRGAYVVTVADIGTAIDTPAELTSASYLNGNPAVTLVVSKQSGQNTVNVADAVRARLAELQPTLPSDVHAEVITDQSVFIQAAVGAIKEHLVLGSILAAIVIYIFLANVRTTLISALAIPTSIVSTFALMKAMDYTLNQITMLALTLMVGIVIDDAIVVLENIYRFIEEKGLPPFQAAIDGTQEIGLAVLATTLSLLAVFVPVGFMGGIVGRFMSSFGLTAAFAIFVSLIISFTLTPMLSSRFITPPSHPGASKQSRFYGSIDRGYTAMLRWSMAHRVILVAVCALVIISIVPLFMVIGKSFTPEDDRAEFQVTLTAPEGSSLPATTTIAERIARDLRAQPGVLSTLTNVGSASRVAVNQASIYVKLVDRDQRQLSQSQLMVRTRELLRAYPSETRTSVQPVSSVGSVGGRSADVQFAIVGPDLQKLAEFAQQLTTRMKASPGLVDIDSSLVFGKPELRVNIDRQRAADLGVNAMEIAQALNVFVGGQRISTFSIATTQYDVTLRAQQPYRTTIEGISEVPVGTTKAGPVPLREVVHIEQTTGPASIDRVNRQRQVTIYANVPPGTSQAAAIANVQQYFADLHLPTGYAQMLAGTSRELGRTGYYFILAISLSFIFMYMVLAAQFESFIHPVTILLTLPIAVPFGLLSLLVMGQTLNIFSGLGMLLLFGIVKKNAILQIDHTNTLRARGLSRYDAIILANRDRLRPILMTTIALVAGMLPLVISNRPGAATNRSIGVLVIGGQSLCLVLTLLAVPVFYSLFDDASGLTARTAARLRPRRRPAVAGAVKTTAVVLAIALHAFVASAQPAPQPQSPQVPIPSSTPPPLPPRVGILSDQPFTLDQVIELVLANNPAIAVNRIDVERARFSTEAASGALDPAFNWQSYYEHAVTPVSSFLGGSTTGSLTQNTLNSVARVNGFLSGSGGNYQVQLSGQRGTSSSQFVGLNPQFPTALTLSLSQPLLRNFSIDPARRQIEVAQKQVTLSTEQFRQQVIGIVASAEQAYWQLTFARQNLDVQMEGLRLAQEQAASNARRANAGTLAPIDATEALTQVGASQQNVYSAQQAVTAAEIQLKELMLPNRDAPVWHIGLTPATPLELAAPSPSLDDAIKTALSNRPELSAADVSASINETDVRFFRNQTRPALDLVGSYTAAGLSGQAATVVIPPEFGSIGGSVPPNLVGGAGQSLSSLFRMTYPTSQLRMDVTVPIRNRTAKADLASAIAQGRQIQLQRQQIEQGIAGDVTNALQAIASTDARVKAAADSARLAEEVYASEQRKFQAGTSTVFLLFQRQTTMINARTQLARAQADLSIAISQYHAATGTSLQVRKVTIHP